MLTAAACGPGEEAADEAEPAEERSGAASLPPNMPDTARLGQPVEDVVLEAEEGEATFYADVLEGRPTASGEAFRQNAMVAAHRAFPFGTVLRVINTDNQREIEVRVIDRGPFAPGKVKPAVIDLSKRAADALGFLSRGRANVRVEVLEWGDGR